MKKVLTSLICLVMILSLPLYVLADEPLTFSLTVNYLDYNSHQNGMSVHVLASKTILFKDVVSVDNIPASFTGLNAVTCTDGGYPGYVSLADGYLAVNGVYGNLEVNILLQPSLTPVPDKTVTVTYLDASGMTIGTTDSTNVYTDGVYNYVLPAPYTVEAVTYYPAGGMVIVSESISDTNVLLNTDGGDTQISDGEDTSSEDTSLPEDNTTTDNTANEGSDVPVSTTPTVPAVNSTATVLCEIAQIYEADYSYEVKYLDAENNVIYEATLESDSALINAQEEFKRLNDSGFTEVYELVDLDMNKSKVLTSICNFDKEAVNTAEFLYSAVPATGSIVVTRQALNSDIRYYVIENTLAEYSSKIAIIGSGSVSIDDLEPGVYTITELGADMSASDFRSIKVEAYSINDGAVFGGSLGVLNGTEASSTGWLNASSNATITIKGTNS